MSTVAAYRHCEDVTRARARNFHYGIRLLPAERRRAMCAVYALARRIDDIGDGRADVAVKAAALTAVRHDLDRLAAGDPGADPVLVALADAARRLPVPLEAFEDLVAGVEMDVTGAAYETIDELVIYCRRVAGSIGRLCVGVFATRSPTADALADDLGVALQLTNILRDVGEDRAAGRTYLPADDLDRFGVDLADPEPAAFAHLVRFEVARARSWYARGWPLLRVLDRRSAACAAAMAGIYRRLLDRIESDPHTVLSRRASLGGWEKAAVATRALVGGGVTA